jgi:hypothetical protein
VPIENFLFIPISIEESCRCFLKAFYSDSLRIYKSMQSEMRKLPPIPTVLDAADRDPRA